MSSTYVSGRKTAMSVGLLIALLGFAGGLRASTADELLAAFGGDDDAARSQARQLLPRENVRQVAPKLVRMLADEREVVWRTAYNVLADLANETSAPGRRRDRAVVTKALMTLVAPLQPEHLKFQGLRLLPLVVAPGRDISPVAALLDDPDLQEKARAALQEMQTPEACMAMRAYLAKAQPAFACALLDSLGFLQDRESLDVIRDKADSDNARVRAAAVRALAWAGDAADLALARQVVTRSDDATRPEASDALLRLTEAMADQGRVEPAVQHWLVMIQQDSGPARDGALTALGRFGDADCVRPMMAAVRQADARTQRVACAALDLLQGEGVTAELIAIYAEAADDLKPLLVRALASKRDPAALPILTEAAGSDVAALRVEALSGLGRAGLPQGVAVLSEAVRSADQQVRQTAAAALLDLADTLRENNRSEAAAAYATVGVMVEDESSQRRVLDGIAARPSADARPAVMRLAENAALADAAPAAMIAVCESLAKAGQKDGVVELFERLQQFNPPTAIKQRMVQCMRQVGVQVDLAGLLGVVKQWYLLGPFELGVENKGWDTAYIGEPRMDLTGAYMAGNRRLKWVRYDSPDDVGRVDLRKCLADRDNAIAYACTEIIVEQDCDAVLLLGADDSERIWLNGEKVFEQFVARGLQVDADRVPVKLHAGKNTILLKIWQLSMGWEFCLRITDPAGQPLRFTQELPSP